jgi:ElaB/YqjD/DUF883 family membrane-anchored ribosome-binding protein
MPETSTTDFNRAMRDAKKQAGGVANEVSDAASQVADAATNGARKTASSFERALRDTIENQPYTAVAIALGLGWLFGTVGSSTAAKPRVTEFLNFVVTNLSPTFAGRDATKSRL